MEGRVMNNGSYFIPRERIYPFLNPGSMNDEEGLSICWETDPPQPAHGRRPRGGDAAHRWRRAGPGGRPGRGQ